MTHISPLLSRRALPEADTDFRQLRHQTKNALQRILCQIAQCRELQSTRQGQHLLEDLERRVRLSASVSDALFGLVAAPAPMPQRLQRLCESTIDLLGDPDQAIRLEMQMETPCPQALTEPVLRIAHELVGNAVKHGLYARSVGAITVRLVQGNLGALRLQVVDDGWGFKSAPEHGEGLSLATLLARQYNGTVALERRNEVTVATVMLRG